MQDRDAKLFWIWLQNICGAGSPMPELLVDAFDGSVEALYRAESDAYDRIPFIKASLKSKLCDKTLIKASEILAYCENEGIGVITPDSPMYPKRLFRIRSKPVVLYCKGILPDLDSEVCIAVVGTRNMSEYGAQTAYSMSYDMAKAGAIIVSGMAKGVDGMAHRGAIDAGGYTVAVIGCGVDRAYPSEHLGLMKEIIRNGAVISEFPPFTPPMGRNFPIRNRIVSGLSLGTLVVEAPSRSGALITAQTALSQGRDVFAVPGKLGEMNSTGTNELIKDGARMVMGASDVLLEYQSLYSDKINLNKLKGLRTVMRQIPRASVAAGTSYDSSENRSAEKPQRVSKRKRTPKAEEETAPVETLQREPFVIPDDTPPIRRAILEGLSSGRDMTPDELVSGSDIQINELLVELTMLELEGAVTALPGGSYRLIK